MQLNKPGRMKCYLGCKVVDLLLCFLLPLVSVTVYKSTVLDKCIRFFRTTAVNKQSLDEVFVISRIIKVSVRVLSQRPRLINLT